MGFFSRTKKTIPPYDQLDMEKRLALYFLLDYLTEYVPLEEMSWALSYLAKAERYFGITKRQIEEMRPFYNTYEKITKCIKEIQNRKIYEYMISNCSNIFILMNGDAEHRKLGEQTYRFYEELGFSYGEVRYITEKYQYRTDI